MRPDFEYKKEWEPYEALDASLLGWAADAGDFRQAELFGVADDLTRLVSPGAYWMSSAEARGLIARHDPEGMAGPRYYRITPAGLTRLGELTR